MTFSEGLVDEVRVKLVYRRRLYKPAPPEHNNMLIRIPVGSFCSFRLIAICRNQTKPQIAKALISPCLSRIRS